jgi:hypothetical protein
MLASASLLLASPTAGAGSTYAFAVNSTADAHDAHPGNGVCADAVGKCTVRAAIEEADALPVGSSITVTVPAATYVLSLGRLVASRGAIRIEGAGSGSAVIDAHGRSQIMVVDVDATVTLEGLTLRGGSAPGSTYGGAVLNAGSLTIAHSVVAHNTATAGGGLANAGGTLSVSSSSITDNRAPGYGGGGIQNGGSSNLPGSVTIGSSTISHNSSSDDGAGILNGQNGHPASASLPDATAPAAKGLVLTVSTSKLEDNVDGNAGGAIANDGGTAAVTGSRLTGNVASGIGGGIASDGTLTVARTTIGSNRASDGGGVDAGFGDQSASVTITGSTLIANRASSFGAAIEDVSDVTVQRSTISGNRAALGGGAIEIDGATATIVDSTLYGNRSAAGAGAISTYSCGSANVSFTTIDHNSNGLGLSCSDVTLNGTIVAGSTAGANCTGAAPSESSGYNLDSGSSCAFSKPTDVSHANPLLWPLADNGGQTQTAALQAGSPAVNAGGQRSNGCPATDERGVPRPQGPACDVGAYELMRAASGRRNT